MSNDLISRKALFEEIQSFRCSIMGLRAGKGVLAYAADEYRKSILQIIEDQATAFDKKKVIEKLEEAEQECNECNDIRGAEAVEYAIEIVEKGGIE